MEAKNTANERARGEDMTAATDSADYIDQTGFFFYRSNRRMRCDNAKVRLQRQKGRRWWCGCCLQTTTTDPGSEGDEVQAKQTQKQTRNDLDSWVEQVIEQ